MTELTQTAIQMQTAIHVKTKVLPGNRVEITLPAHTTAKMVDVFVVLPEQLLEETQTLSILEIIENVRGKIKYRSAEDIDRQIQAERDSWDF
ncbi:hypothetical protein Pse7367_3834 (plasmid) [Thalassoporum mexicanum PCC 7367]|uniref:hypothetical protein n=1 Tax=Thalassoporum mexicanum TaxID=3457544 RepID=UPI00029FDC0B|nr:hypothetical protein [Pseudanabaena sp. PCC 7367]AFY72057.1 hypothetical protein Pse7367_3834 [Pseudanabaena sp. PCC 7367]